MLYIALPTYNGTINATLSISLLKEVPHHICHVQSFASSLLTRAFNLFWCEALNLHADYFLMVHADIEPQGVGWIQTLMDEMETSDADAVSVIVPLKDEHGMTSTALTRAGNTNQRRVTMREAMQLRETFDALTLAEFFGEDPNGAQLLLNTGMLLVNLNKHRTEIEQLKFWMRDEITRNADGTFVNWTWSEDWAWSRDASARGLKLWATRKVKILHHGGYGYCNCCAWGTQEHDPSGHVIEER